MIFLDTGFLFALVSEGDVNHHRVSEVLEEYRGQHLSDFVITTNHVVAETITLIRAKGHRHRDLAHDLAVHVGRKLFAEVFARDTT